MLKVALIGRPNVGKSTLFNRLAGKKFALVHDTPGVTRDWREAPAKLLDLNFIILDSAGIETGNATSLKGRMTKVALAALQEADVALFMVDVRAGLTPDDKDVIALLRKADKPIIMIANKCDHNLPAGYDEFHAVGFGEPIAFSAEHGIGLRDLYDALQPHADNVVEEEAGEKDMALHLAIIGRPNVGKSTLVNALIGKDRMLTGPESGLTRDAVHIAWEYEGKPVRLVDTAGLRRATKIHEELEEMSVAETKRAIRLAHVVVLVVDAEQMFDKQDLQLAQMVEKEGRGLIIAINKWDLIKNKEEVTTSLRHFLDKNIAQLPDIPIVMISAIKGQKLDKLMTAIFAMFELWNKRITTSAINKWLSPLLEHHPPPAVQGKRIKIRYMTQIKTRPPTFVLWVSKPLQLPDTYLRYLSNNFRENFEMPGVTLRFQMKKGDNPYDGKD